MTTPASTPGRLVAGPFNRVEGDLEVRLDVAEGRVTRAEVCAPMYRGFEQMLVGKAPRDALAIVPRICGICSVTQSVAAAQALAALAGIEAPPNGRLATQLTLATETLADHLTHFYLFFMPDFTQAAYRHAPWQAEAERRFAPQRGAHTREFTAARQRWMTLMGTLAGKWPHTLSLEPGGTARAIEAGERTRLLARLREFRGFVQQQFLGDRLEAFAAIDSLAGLRRWAGQGGAAAQGDLRFFLARAEALGFDRLGLGPALFISNGSFRDEADDWLMPPGVWDAQAARLEAPDPMAIAEDSTHAWLVDGLPLHPAQGLTQPVADKPGAYTWNKAPRHRGRVAETGALARQLVAGHPLLREAVAEAGAGSVFSRVLARAVELALVLPAMERWLQALQPGYAWCAAAEMPAQGHGAGLVEAARGALGHWVSVEAGRISRYQIVAPTSWNFSPRDAAGRPGALEMALEHIAVPEPGAVPVAVHHVVRSFDPCMVCTVH
jgi:uptake hydrogenase large subunit